MQISFVSIVRSFALSAVLRAHQLIARIKWYLLDLPRKLLKVGTLPRNATFAVLQVVCTTVCVFLAYKVVISELGLEVMGIWSLLMAGSALARVADFSGGGALARFVALESSNLKCKRVILVIHTVVLNTVFLNILLGALLTLIAVILIPRIVDFSIQEIAFEMVPYAVATTILSGVALGLLSAIDGVHRADQRAMVASGSSVVLVALTWFLVPVFGAEGYGIAQVAQQIVVISMAWVVLRYHVADLGFFPWRWSQEIFRVTIAYALKLNAISGLNLLLEPLVKFSINFVGGVIAVSYYELGSRLVTQLRSFIVAGSRPLIPAIAAGDDIYLEITLGKAFSVIGAVSCVAVVVSVLSGPIFSFVMLEKVEFEVLFVVCTLSMGWGINTLCLPLYLAGLAKGILRWNIVAQLTIAVSVLFGLVVQSDNGGFEMLIACMSLGLALSAVVVIVGNAQSLGVVPACAREWKKLIWAGLFIVAFGSAGFACIWILGDKGLDSITSSGSSLTKDSHRVRSGRGSPDGNGRRDRGQCRGSCPLGGDRGGAEQPPEARLAGAEHSPERRWRRHDGDRARGRRGQADGLALAAAVPGRRRRRAVAREVAPTRDCALAGRDGRAGGGPDGRSATRRGDPLDGPRHGRGAPVELVRFARCEAQRHKGRSSRRILPTTPAHCKAPHGVVAASVAEPPQVFEDPHQRQPFPARSRRVRHQQPLQLGAPGSQPWLGLDRALVVERGRP